MSTTASVVDKSSRQSAYRRHGYFFRQAAMLTISLGFALHVYRVIFGDELTLKYVATMATDRILLIPMTYATITGILVWPRVRFANGRHRAFFTASIVYIAGSVPLHIYMSYVVRDLSIVSWFPMWFSYLLLIAVYPAFLTMFWRLRYKD
ncbi:MULTISPECIES: hypothetical protein [Mycobacterium]|uniref:Uncharacterized protein n=1 Tax=Mycobacterium pseudoshottsii TaxID=265949 RepID=A0A9N7LIQ0_9MYCO|nr:MULTISPECIES: hypothetical protein [Mycobacterium]EPQ44698.1 hypothetical protein MMSP_0458 [Mycobacterium sp. 012931]MBC9864793.1 hypothetical protein [Mycobacterium pseudoshottsii]RFZ71683.1 hypothetical protein DL240490_00572 [Mycobacterium marinum]BBA85981.1 hypothetical protein MPSD_02400 [Mycobacterium pseudoshottsii JCM 15466]BDN80022.1 hypothetical protein NJB1907Z4_C02370 [Mycobacterium pseudoshottsii]